MAYCNFDINKATDLLGVRVMERKQLFADVADVPVSPYLKMVLEHESVFSISSEMARREMIIAPILDDIFAVYSDRFAIFSAENFDVDRALELKGLADYIISLSPVKLQIQAPVIAVAESKRNDPYDGIGQCVAELYASALYNERKNNPIGRLFGVSTNGEQWMFGEYIVKDKTFTYFPHRISLDRLPRIIGILSYMRDEALRMYDQPKDV